jgi:hypothetical protein
METIAWVYLGNNCNIVIPIDIKLKDLPFFVFASLSDLTEGIEAHKEKYPGLYKWWSTPADIENPISQYNRLFIHDDAGEPVSIRIELIPLHGFGQIHQDILSR